MYFNKLISRNFRLHINFKYFSNAPESHLFVPFPERKVQLKIGKPERVEVEVAYIDTIKEAIPNQLIALLIHGTPGSYHDYYNQITYLTEKGIRVIAPTYPSYRFVHKTKRQYRHSLEDRAKFTRDLLQFLQIKKVHLLVSHSSALFPALHLSCYNPPEIGSLALVNPAALRLSNVVRPLWLHKILVYGGFYLPTYFALRLMFPLIQLVSPTIIDDVDHVFHAVTTVLTADFKNVQAMAKIIKDKRLASLLIYSLNDKLFEPTVYAHFLNQLGVQKTDVWAYDEKGTLETKGVTDAWIKILELKNGTHYSQWKYPDIVNKALFDLINKVN